MTNVNSSENARGPERRNKKVKSRAALKPLDNAAFNVYANNRKSSKTFRASDCFVDKKDKELKNDEVCIDDMPCRTAYNARACKLFNCKEGRSLSSNFARKSSIRSIEYNIHESGPDSWLFLLWWHTGLTNRNMIYLKNCLKYPFSYFLL